MRVYRMLGLLIATATALLITPAAAHAEPYPAEPPASSVSDGEVADGGFVTFAGKGYLPFEQISIEISYNGSDSTASLKAGSPGGLVLAALPERRAITVRADADGTFSIRLKLTEVGDVVLVATGLTSGVTVTQNVTVVESSGGDGNGDNGDSGDDGDNNADGGSGDLPTTGSDGSVLTYTLYGGFGAILLGAGAIWLARSRRRTTQL